MASNHPTTVHDELLKLVPVLTEAARRQDPDLATARDCANWTRTVCDPQILPADYQCPKYCPSYQPRSVR